MRLRSEIRNPKSAVGPRIAGFGLRSAIGYRLAAFPSRSGLGAACAGFLALACSALAQPATPHIGYVYPAGGRQGATFQIAVGGQYLDGVTNVHFSGAGASAVVIDFYKPMPQGQFNLLRDQLRELQERKRAALRDGQPRPAAEASTNTWTAADDQKMAEIREKILKNPPNRNATPAIAEVATIQVVLATNAEPGDREIRLGAPNGLSNPLGFHVGQLPEFSKPPARVPNPDVDRLRERFGRRPQAAPPKSETRITLPAIVNGQIMPGAVDRFRFTARLGQHLVVAASARALIPYLPDAVPGWFQATLALYDAKGKELAYADDYRFNPDPVLSYQVPKDGDYVIQIKDSIYRGREDFVYRIAVGELPFVTSLFPLGAQVGTDPAVELKGWNLPVTTLTPDATAPGIQRLTVRTGDRVSNPMPFAVDTLPEGRELEANNLAVSAQPIVLPVIVNGRIDQPGDLDVFRFEGRAGAQIVAEVTARRLNSPLDSVIRLTDDAGRQLALNDDHEDKGAGLTTHHADSRLHVTLPADGTYHVHLGDAQHQGGPEYGYRLRLSPPQPDFELRVVPSSLTIRAGVSTPLTVYALRKDGFSNDIALALKDAPRGFTLGGARVPAGQEQIRITLAAPPTSQAEPVSLSLEGRALIRGHEIIHPAVPAEDMMQAFAYRHLVPAKELKVALAGRGMPRAAVRILGAAPVKIPSGGTARVRLDAPARGFADRMQLELSEPPEGISLQTVAPSRTGTELVFRSDAAKVKPGLQGNLIVEVFADRPGPAGKGKANPRRAPLGTLPAIPFEVVAP